MHFSIYNYSRPRSMKSYFILVSRSRSTSRMETANISFCRSLMERKHASSHIFIRTSLCYLNARNKEWKTNRNFSFVAAEFISLHARFVSDLICSSDYNISQICNGVAGHKWKGAFKTYTVYIFNKVGMIKASRNSSVRRNILLLSFYVACCVKFSWGFLFQWKKTQMADRNLCCRSHIMDLDLNLTVSLLINPLLFTSVRRSYAKW